MGQLLVLRLRAVRVFITKNLMCGSILEKLDIRTPNVHCVTKHVSHGGMNNLHDHLVQTHANTFKPKQ